MKLESMNMQRQIHDVKISIPLLVLRCPCEGQIIVLIQGRGIVNQVHQKGQQILEFCQESHWMVRVMKEDAMLVWLTIAFPQPRTVS